MGTNSPDRAREFLRELHGTGIRSALIHGEDMLEAGTLGSDLDLAFASSFGEALDAVELAASRASLTPIVCWAYDTNSTTVVLAELRADGRVDGVQVDLLVDPEGLGKYGVRTGPLVAASRPGRLYPRVAPLDEALYLARKAALKAQPERLVESRGAMNGFPEAEVSARSSTLLTGQSLATERGLGHPIAWRVRRGVEEGRRAAYRIAVPLGPAVEVGSMVTASEVDRRLQGIAPSVAIANGRVSARLASRRNTVTLLPSGSADLGVDRAVERVLASMARHFCVVSERARRFARV